METRLTPELLRRPPPDCFTLRTEDWAMLADALQIADSAARSDIEVYAWSAGDLWYDLTRAYVAPMDDTLLDTLKLAERYLTARGKLEKRADGCVRMLP